VNATRTTAAARKANLTVRTAQPDDVLAIRHLLASTHRPSVHNWPWEEHLGQDVFLLTLLEGRPVGALLAWPDTGPVAWARLAVLARDVPAEAWLDRVLVPLRVTLRCLGARLLAWMDLGEWAGEALQAHGFHQSTRLTTLLKEDRRLPPLPSVRARLRAAEAADIAEVARVDRAAFTPPWWLSARTLERMRRQAACFLVAERQGRCVGYVAGERSDFGGHISRLAVAPRWQGQGLGRLLLSEALSHLWGLGIAEVMLNTQESNQSSRRLYQRMGFRTYGWPVGVYERLL
jgi:ribosomal-protein-alanine N-acetyltransferase